MDLCCCMKTMYGFTWKCDESKAKQSCLIERPRSSNHPRRGVRTHNKSSPWHSTHGLHDMYRSSHVQRSWVGQLSAGCAHTFVSPLIARLSAPWLQARLTTALNRVRV
jgi:hypothetical protein